MMSKAMLRQALKFKNNVPTYSQVEKLYNKACKYQEYHQVLFIKAKYRGKAEILNQEKFFEFIGEEVLNNVPICSFEELEGILNASTRKESIETSGDSKNSITKVFDKTILFQHQNENPRVYKSADELSHIKTVLAVENGESFLNIYPMASKFGFENFVYLAGFSNSLTREFLKDKDVVFFLDYDLEAIRIYDSFTCKSKQFFKHPNIEKLFKNKKIRNEKLYRKQLKKEIPNNHNELQWLITLIENNSGVIEQEVLT